MSARFFRFTALSLCVAMRVAAQNVDATVEREKCEVALEEARVRLLADPAIAPLYDQWLQSNAKLQAAREASVARNPELSEKTAKVRALVGQLAAMTKDPSLSEEERRTQRNALSSQMRSLTTEVGAAQRALGPDPVLVTLQAQVDEAAVAVQNALTRKLGEDPKMVALQAQIDALSAPPPAPKEPTVPETVPPAPQVDAPAVPPAPVTPPDAAGH